MTSASIGIHPLLSGRRHFRIEASASTLDVTAASFDPATLARFALECMRGLTVLDGPLLLLLPGLQAVSAARELLRRPGACGWPADELRKLALVDKDPKLHWPVFRLIDTISTTASKEKGILSIDVVERGGGRRGRLRRASRAG